MAKGFCYIMLFYVLGEIVSLCMGGIIPGSVCGMVLLFLALTFNIVHPRNIEKTAHALTRNMALFFIPAGVGIMSQYQLLIGNWVVLLTVSVVTTLLVLIIVGFTEERLDQRLSQRKGGNKT